MGITVVLSVGGNDIRHILADMKGVESTVKLLHANYAALLQRLLRLRPVVNTVVCMQYRPCMSEGNARYPLMKVFGTHLTIAAPHSSTFTEMDQRYYGVYSAMATLPGPESAAVKLNRLMHKVYAPIVATAFEHGLALIDLPNTFDVKNNALCVLLLPSPPLTQRSMFSLTDASVFFRRSYTHQIEPSALGGRLIATLM